MHNEHIVTYSHTKFHEHSLKSVYVITGSRFLVDGRTDGRTDRVRIQVGDEKGFLKFI